MPSTARRKRVAFEDVPTTATKKRRTDSPRAARTSTPQQRLQQQTLTQIQFVPQLDSSLSDNEHEGRSGRSSKPATHRTSPTRQVVKKRQRASTSKKQKSTITQMDFLSGSSSFGLDEEDMLPLPVHDCTKERPRSKHQPKNTTNGTTSDIGAGGLTGSQRTTQEQARPQSGGRSMILELGDPNRLQEVVITSQENKELTPRAIHVQPRSSRVPKGALQMVVAPNEQNHQIENSQGSVFPIYADAPDLMGSPVPHTPVRNRRDIIPSSQSPESLPPSSRRRGSRQQTRSPARSPLKDKSANTQTPSKKVGQKQGFGSGKKRVCELAKSKIVILPIALTSQGAVSRGDILTRSQWPALHSSPDQQRVDPVRASRDVIPCSQEEDEDDETQPGKQSSADDLPGVNKVRKATIEAVMRPNDPETPASSNLSGNLHRVGTPKRSHDQPTWQDQDEIEEPPFSPGTPIRTSSPAPLHSPEHASRTLPLSQSDSEAAAAQLQSDIILHTQSALGSAAASSATRAVEPHLPPSQVSTQAPTQSPSYVRGKNPAFVSQSPREEIYIKLKGSSSMEIPLDAIPWHSQGRRRTQHQVLDVPMSESGYLDTDDLNPPSTPDVTKIPYGEETRSLTTIVRDEDKRANEDNEEVDRKSRGEIATEPTLPPNQPYLATQAPTAETDTDIDTSSPLITPHQHLQAESPTSQSRSRIYPIKATNNSNKDNTDVEFPNQHAGLPFSSSPITTGVHWTLSDSLLESLPGPPPGWEGYPAVDDGEMRRM